MTEFGSVRAGAVSFERRYAASPEELWAAWTEPDRIARWLGATVSGPIAPGSAFTLVWGPDADSQVAIVVRELTPPAQLEWEWTINGEPPTVLQVTLSPENGGTVLRLDHSKLPPAQIAGLSAGWHDFLETLPEGAGGMRDEVFMALVPAYKEKVEALG